MPKVTIQKKTKLSANEAFQKVKTLLENDHDLKKLDAAYKTTFDEKGLTGEANGKMFKAHMNVKNAGSGSEIEIVVDLPLALVLVKGVVESTLNKKLEQIV